MSTDLILFAPQSVPALSPEDMAHAKNFAGSGSVAPPRISTKGNRFSFLVGNEVVRQHDQLTLDVVVIGVRKTTSRVWYANPWNPNADKPDKPACWSGDDRVPGGPEATRPTLLTPEGQRPVRTCGECPKNIRGSGANGLGKACSYKQALVVVLPDDLDGQAWKLDVSGMGAFGDSQPDLNLRSFKDYRDYLMTPRGGNLANGVPMNALITRLSFDARQSVPVLRFSVAPGAGGGAAWLPAEYIALTRKRGLEPDVLAMLDQDEEQGDGAASTSAAVPTVPVAAAPVVAAPVVAAPIPAAPVAPRLAHPDVPEAIRTWARHPLVTEQHVTDWLAANLPEALQVPPATPAAPVAPAAPQPAATPATIPARRGRKPGSTKAAAAAAAAPIAAPIATPVATPVTAPIPAPVAPVPAPAFAQAELPAGETSLQARMAALLGNGFED